MTNDEWKTFLREPGRVAVASVVREDGRPHATPVWIEFDGEQIIFNTSHDSLKGKALQRDPRVSLVVQDETPPFSFVKIDGTVSISDDMDELRYWAGRIGGRYMGEDQADAFGERNAVPGEVLVRVTIRNVAAFKNIAE